MDKRFVQVGIRPIPFPQSQKEKWYEGKPMISMVVLTAIILGCLFCNLFISKDPSYMDLYHTNIAPNREFWFGTDTMGRDIFSMIWYGGRISLLIGFLATVISTVIAILYGVISGFATKWLDSFLMRLVEIFLCIPNLLLIILVQSILGKANVLTISIAIGLTSWTSMAKVIRTEVKQIRNSEYVIAARCMGAGFFHIMWKHMVPNFLSSIMFMIVMNIRSAIIAESTLSFMGIGLPLEVISWGSMLSLAGKALLSGSWWIVLVPGAFLVVTLVCVTEIGEWMRKNI